MGGLQLHFIGQSFKEMLFEPASVGAEDFRLKYKNRLWSYKVLSWRDQSLTLTCRPLELTLAETDYPTELMICIVGNVGAKSLVAGKQISIFPKTFDLMFFTHIKIEAHK